MTKKVLAVLTLIAPLTFPIVGVAGQARIAGSKALPPPSKPPSLATVTSICVPPNTVMTLYRWSYKYGYLLCIASDDNTGVMQLFVLDNTGGVKHLATVGGAMSPDDLVRFGVPKRLARPLYKGLDY
jgi:hypothetical protein